MNNAARHRSAERRHGVSASRLLLALLLAITVSGPAVAHGDLRASEPREGAVLREPPSTLSLSFSEPTRVTSLRLLDEAGREHALQREARGSAASELRAAIAERLPPGSYRVEYRGMSADGHVGGGVLRFRVEQPGR